MPEPDAVAAAIPAEALLVDRVRAGESQAFQELYLQYRNLVLSLANRLLNDPEEARDLCQEVFLAVHRRIGGLRDPARLRSWICRIAVTRAYNVERSFRRRLKSFTVSLDLWSERGGVAYAGGHDPERACLSSEARRRIDQALSELPFVLRSVVVLRDVEGLSYEEIAEAVEANLGTVKSRLARGRAALRERLRDLIEPLREGQP